MRLFNWIGDFFDNESGIGSSTSSAITDDTFSSISIPAVNIDGSPMIGGVDIHGHPFGVTDDTFSDTGIHSGIGCDDMFSSGIGSSSFDDSFSSSIGCGSSDFDS